MTLLRVRLMARRTRIAVAVVAVLIGGCWSVFSYSTRVMLRNEAAYYNEMRQLHHDYEQKLRGEIDRLVRDEPAGPLEVDRIFEMLGLSAVASRSREVDSWVCAPHSPERTAIALKWARVAADEAAYEAIVCELCARDFEQGRMPHHITYDEVRPFRMPDDWTVTDLKY